MTPVPQRASRLAAIMPVSALLAATLVLCQPGWTQSGAAGFDPAHPFARIQRAEQWKAVFILGTPDLVADDPYANMTSREFSLNTWKGQSLDGKFASAKGTGGAGVAIRSPYPYKSAEEHYRAWFAAAGSPTAKPREALPDWSGDWQGNAVGVLGQEAKISAVMAALSDEYKPRFAQLLRAETAGRHWWPTAFCLPDGFGRFYSEHGSTWHFMMDRTMVLITKDRPNNETRYVYTDGRGFLPKELQFPQWYGASQGFWDGDDLVMWSAQFKAWVIGNGMPEYSDKLQVVERMKRLGDEILVDVTLYDPEAFAFPWHDAVIFKQLPDWTVAPATFSECVSTNNVFLDADGALGERTPGTPGYIDLSDPRPWATAFERGEAAAAAKRTAPK
jgi:hypothetical protein